MNIRKAEPSQYSEIRAFYHSLIDAVGSSTNSVGWKKDIYPAPEYLMKTISDGEFYIAVVSEKIAAVMILNHESNEEYQKFQWPTEAKPDEVTVIHALGVAPSHTGKGYAKMMVKFAIETARKNHQKVIRLDVLKGNAAAKQLYFRLGFQYLHTLPMFYEDTGWTDFELYEYRL